MEMKNQNEIDPQWAWQVFEPSAEHPWDRKRAAHLYRRAGLGADLRTLDASILTSPARLVDELFSQDAQAGEFRQTADMLTRTILAGGDPKRLSAAWVYRMMLTPNPLLEKATLLWHGHFATGAEKVQDAKLMWNQNELIRSHALGDFADLTQAIAQDPAMLIYLDSAINRKAHPNENFARELMELFCLGEGNYTEQDVQELARCFTGWEIKSQKFRKNRYQHDSGEKAVLGESGTFDGEDAVEIVLQQPSLEMFLARKWYRFFIADEPAPSDELLRPLAKAFREKDLQIAPALKMLLSSNLFFSKHAMGQKIKSPVELVIGTLRAFKATANSELIADGLFKIGQGLFYPPNVKGWEGGRTWINSSTLLGRANLFSRVLFDGATRFDGKSLLEHLADHGVHDADSAVEHLETVLLPRRLDDKTRNQLLATADRQKNDREQTMRSLLHAFTSLPQCQLG